jgi:two-component system, OmpR family, KDP operon response regulator KdpE
MTTMAEPSARVLFIEDDGGLAGVVVRHLRARGHDARSVASAEEAVELMGSGFRPTVVLLDINLPGQSGWDLLRTGGLRAAGSPPVYVVSATAVTPARLREFGVAGFLPKPFALPTLIEVVERNSDPAGHSDANLPGGVIQ